MSIYILLFFIYIYKYMNSYFEKYIKYINKYLNLKSQIGGNLLDELQKKITYTENYCIDKDDYFHQH